MAYRAYICFHIYVTGKKMAITYMKAFIYTEAYMFDIYMRCFNGKVNGKVFKYEEEEERKFQIQRSYVGKRRTTTF